MHRVDGEFTIIGPDSVGDVTGTLVVIDVIRAFSVACRILEHDPATYQITQDVDYALAQREANPSTIVLGEVGGELPPGFDYQNNPIEPAFANVMGLPVIHRSSNGTTAVVNAKQASTIYCASFLNARATTRRLLLSDEPITFCATGIYFHNHPLGGDEDIALAEWIIAQMRGEHTNPLPYLERVLHSASGQLFSTDPNKDINEIYATMELNRYDKSIRVVQREGKYFLVSEHLPA